MMKETNKSKKKKNKNKRIYKKLINQNDLDFNEKYVYVIIT